MTTQPSQQSHTDNSDEIDLGKTACYLSMDK